MPTFGLRAPFWTLQRTEALGGKPEILCSIRALPLLTHTGSRAAEFAVMHNTALNAALC
jgi:hypothetical protein